MMSGHAGGQKLDTSKLSIFSVKPHARTAEKHVLQKPVAQNIYWAFLVHCSKIDLTAAAGQLNCIFRKIIKIILTQI
jgi:hypothetical protein